MITVIDPDAVARAAKADRSKKTSIDTAYGHEQQHVKNVIEISEDAEAKLAAAEKKEYDNAEDARKDAQKIIDEVDKDFRDRVDLDQNHRGTDPKSPPKGKPVEPIGEMPEDPVEFPPDARKIIGRDADKILGKPPKKRSSLEGSSGGHAFQPSFAMSSPTGGQYFFPPDLASSS